MTGLAYFDVILFLHFLLWLGTESSAGCSSMRRSLPLPVFFFHRSLCLIADGTVMVLFPSEMRWLVLGIHHFMYLLTFETQSPSCNTVTFLFVPMCVCVMRVCLYLQQFALLPGPVSDLFLPVNLHVDASLSSWHAVSAFPPLCALFLRCSLFFNSFCCSLSFFLSLRQNLIVQSSICLQHFDIFPGFKRAW